MTTDDQGKAEKAFKEFGKRVDTFIVELKEASEKLEDEYKDKFSELKQSAKKMKEEVKNKDRWKEVEESLEKAGEEFKKAFEAAFKKRESK